jgi:hypothetical protein
VNKLNGKRLQRSAKIVKTVINKFFQMREKKDEIKKIRQPF